MPQIMSNDHGGPTRCSATRILAATAGLALAATCASAQISWNGLSGNWSNAANWTPANVPNIASENAVISAPGSYIVSVDGGFNFGSLTMTNPTGVVQINNAQGLGCSGNVVNDSTLTINTTAGASGTSWTTLAPAVSITGTGTFVLNASPANSNTAFLTYSSSSNVVTHGMGHTIRGTGRIYTNIINNGNVFADSAGNVLLLTTTAKTNNNLMRATNGAFLDINVPITQGPSGLLLADGGTIRLASASVTNGVITAQNGGLIDFTGTTILNSVTLNGPSAIENAQTVQLGDATGLVHNGTMTINATAGGSLTDIQVLTSTSLNGTGTIILNANPANSNTAYLTYSSSSNVVTHGMGHTIRGTGRIYTNIINNGSVFADSAGNVLLLTTTAKTNNSLMRATNGAFLDINVPITQGPSGLLLADGGTIRLASASVTNGVITAQNGGLIDFTGTTILNSVTLNGPSAIENAQTVQLGDATGLVHNGTMTVNATAGASLTDIQVLTNTSLNGTGTIILNADPLNNNTAYLTYSSSSNTLSHGSSHTIRGTGRIYTRVINDGLISADSPGNTLLLTTTSKTNNNLMRATNGGILDSTVPVTQATSGRIIADNSRVRMGSASVTGGQVIAQGAGGLVEIYGTTDFDSLTFSGRAEINNAQDLRTTSGFTNNGLITVNASAGLSTTFLQIRASAAINGTGEIRLNANSGNINTAYITYVSSANVLTLSPGQTVSGRGRIYTRTDNQGTISPGVGVGGIGEFDSRLNINHLPGGLIDIEIGGAAPAEFDRITGIGSITLNGGTLRVTTVNGFNPTPGQSVTIVSGPAISGTFCETILPIGWAVTYGSNSITMVYTGCVGDTDNGSGCGVPDSGVTIDDLLFFLFIFENGDLRADVDDGSATGARDGGVTIDDLLYFLQRFEAGC